VLHIAKNAGPFREIDGVNPQIHRGNAFCGSGSMYLHNSFALLDNSHNWGRTDMRRVFDGDSAQWGYKTDEFPYICMAYRCDYVVPLISTSV
jgi:hypothetical protein